MCLLLTPLVTGQRYVHEERRKWTPPHPFHSPAVFPWNVGNQTGILADRTCFLLSGVGAAFLLGIKNQIKISWGVIGRLPSSGLPSVSACEKLILK